MTIETIAAKFAAIADLFYSEECPAEVEAQGNELLSSLFRLGYYMASQLDGSWQVCKA